MLGVGVVLDVPPRRSLWRDPTQQLLLRKRAENFGDLYTLLRSQIERDGGVRVDQVCRLGPFDPEEVQRALRSLEEDSIVEQHGGLWVSKRFWRSLLEKAERWIHEYHKSHPGEPGMPVQRFCDRVRAELDLAEAPERVIEALETYGYVVRADRIRNAEQPFPVPEQFREQADRIRLVLKLSELSPPSRKELAPDRNSIHALRYLLQCRRGDSAECVGCHRRQGLS